jgi:signal transduction histidine kinase
MRRAPIRIRVFILVALIVLLVAPTLAGGAGWLIEHDRERANVHTRVNTVVAYLGDHRGELHSVGFGPGFAKVLEPLDLLVEAVIIGPSEKSPVYSSPALAQGFQGKAPSGRDVDRKLIPVGTGKSPATLVVDLYYRPASGTTAPLVGLLTGIVVLLAGLAGVAWLAGRWMVAPLAGLSAQVDKVAGGDLGIAVPRSRIGEIANIAQAVEGMTDALGESAQRRAEADEARRFLVTSVAHDLRTPLFALRGHLQAIRSRLGDPGLHLERAEARADALERLIGNLFAYTRDDYAQPAIRLEDVAVGDLLEEVTTGLEHAARAGDNTFALDGDPGLVVSVDRDRTKRALTNVLDNAIRYSPRGTPVEMSWAAVDGTAVRITVHDHGPGIDPELLPHVFEPGIQGISGDGGAGLGLTIAKRLLEHQHATLTAENDPAGGATLDITLARAE